MLWGKPLFLLLSLWFQFLYRGTGRGGGKGEVGCGRKATASLLGNLVDCTERLFLRLLCALGQFPES